MANKNLSPKGESKSNFTPFIIIGLIFLATVAGIYWISQTGGGQSNTAVNSNQGSNTAQQVSTYNSAPPGASPAHFKGGADAKVVVEEFADFQCPACGIKHEVFNELYAEYGSRIKFVFRNFPLQSQHPKAYEAAVAAESAGLQGKFWEMQNLLFANQQKWTSETNHRALFDEYAKTIGIDVDKFNNDFLGISAKTRVDADMKRGYALNLRSTPSLYVNGTPIPFEQMTMEALKPIIDAELKKAGIDSGSDEKSDNDEKASEDNKSEETNSDQSSANSADKK